MFNLIKKDDALNVKNINVLIYGEPGIGKTSLACTTSNPLLLDFDKGAHRSAFRKDTIQINSWNDINDNFDKFIKLIDKYDTVIIDTIDKLLDMIGESLLQKEPRYANKLKLQYYGALKNDFNAFAKRLRAANKDLIFICHVKEEMNGDIKEKRPMITGGSKDIVYQNSDFIGYYSKQQNNRVLDFDPNEYFYAKNCAGVNKLIVDDFKTNPDYFSGILDSFKNAINELTADQKALIKLINEYQLKIEMLDDITGFNAMFDEVKLMTKGQVQIWNLLETQAGFYEAKFDKKAKLFVGVKNEN